MARVKALPNFHHSILVGICCPSLGLLVWGGRRWGVTNGFQPFQFHTALGGAQKISNLFSQFSQKTHALGDKRLRPFPFLAPGSQKYFKKGPPGPVLFSPRKKEKPPKERGSLGRCFAFSPKPANERKMSRPNREDLRGEKKLSQIFCQKKTTPSG